MLEPYDPIPGRVPRKVAIDRKKKEYASFNLEELLAGEEIDFNSRNTMVEWLPLELSDDTTFDDYSNEEWMQRRVDEEGRLRSIPAKGLFREANGNEWRYRPLLIEGYDSTK